MIGGQGLRLAADRERKPAIRRYLPDRGAGKSAGPLHDRDRRAAFRPSHSPRRADAFACGRRPRSHDRSGRPQRAARRAGRPCSPLLPRTSAAASPAGPAPMIATSTCSVIGSHPCSNGRAPVIGRTVMPSSTRVMQAWRLGSPSISTRQSKTGPHHAKGAAGGPRLHGGFDGDAERPAASMSRRHRVARTAPCHAPRHRREALRYGAIAVSRPFEA